MTVLTDGPTQTGAESPPTVSERVLVVEDDAVVGTILVESPNLPEGCARRRRDANEHALGHQEELATVRSRARMISAVEVAPGS